MTRIFVIDRHSLEQGFFGRAKVLRHEFAGKLRHIVHHLGFKVGELPVPGHDIDPQEIAGPHHVSSLGPQGRAGALPRVAAIKKQRARTFSAQLIHQTF